MVIPNWNGADFIADCLFSLEKQTKKHTVLVVDNGSVDNSIELVEKNFPKAVIIRNDKNLGFAGGVNKGLDHALKNGAKFVALFNNDAVASPDWLENLVSSAKKDKTIGIVTGKLLTNDGKQFDSTGECYSIAGFPFPRDRNLADKGQRNEGEYIFGASGGASLYRTEALNQIGLFDEKFFAYYEDVDISFRMQLAGWKVFYEPKAVAHHKISATSSRVKNFTRYHATKNIFILYFKNMPGWLLLKYLPLFLVKSCLLFGSSLIKLKPHIWLKGFLAFLALFPKVLRDRSAVQHSRQATTSHIDALLSRRLI